MDENILSDKLPEVKIPTYGLFPTPISVYTAYNHKQLKEEITTFISMMNPDDVKQSPRSDINLNVMQLGEDNILDKPELSNVKAEILQAVDKANEQSYAYTLSDPINITDSVIELGSIYPTRDFTYPINSLTNLGMYCIEILISPEKNCL